MGIFDLFKPKKTQDKNEHIDKEIARIQAESEERIKKAERRSYLATKGLDQLTEKEWESIQQNGFFRSFKLDKEGMHQHD